MSLSFGPDALTVRDVTVDVVDRRIRLGDGERSIPYGRIRAVDEDGRTLTIETDGGTYRFVRGANTGHAAGELRARASAIAG